MPLLGKRQNITEITPKKGKREHETEEGRSEGEGGKEEEGEGNLGRKRRQQR